MIPLLSPEINWENCTSRWEDKQPKKVISEGPHMTLQYQSSIENLGQVYEATLRKQGGFDSLTLKIVWSAQSMT
jgi:hypothetical protein